VAAKVKVIGGKKMTLALASLEKKITNAGVLRVGFLEGSRYPPRTNARFLKAVGSNATPKLQPPLPIAQAAFWNEFGTAHAPARPFFRDTIAKQSKVWADVLAAALKQTDYDGQAALAILGEDMVGDVQRAIATWSAPPNSEFTIKVKGFDKPLVDSGDMQDAVAFEVKK
jgi:hypothetical protein